MQCPRALCIYVMTTHLSLRHAESDGLRLASSAHNNIAIHTYMTMCKNCVRFVCKIIPLNAKTNHYNYMEASEHLAHLKVTQHPQQYQYMQLPQNQGLLSTVMKSVTCSLPDCDCGVAFHPKLAKEEVHHLSACDCDWTLDTHRDIMNHILQTQQ